MSKGEKIFREITVNPAGIAAGRGGTRALVKHTVEAGDSNCRPPYGCSTRPWAISFASVGSPRKHATLVVLWIVDRSSCSSTCRRVSSFLCARTDAAVVNIRPSRSDNARIARVDRATMLSGTKRCSRSLTMSRSEFKHHPDSFVDRSILYVCDRVRVRGDEIERRACVGNWKWWCRLARKHESCPIGAHLLEVPCPPAIGRIVYVRGVSLRRSIGMAMAPEGSLR